ANVGEATTCWTLVARSVDQRCLRQPEMRQRRKSASAGTSSVRRGDTSGFMKVLRADAYTVQEIFALDANFFCGDSSRVSACKDGEPADAKSSLCDDQAGGCSEHKAALLWFFSRGVKHVGEDATDKSKQEWKRPQQRRGYRLRGVDRHQQQRDRQGNCITEVAAAPGDAIDDKSEQEGQHDSPVDRQRCFQHGIDDRGCEKRADVFEREPEARTASGKDVQKRRDTEAERGEDHRRGSERREDEDLRDVAAAALGEVGEQDESKGQADERGQKMGAGRHAESEGQQDDAGTPLAARSLQSVGNPDGGVDKAVEAPQREDFIVRRRCAANDGRAKDVERQGQASALVAEEPAGDPPKTASQPDRKEDEGQAQKVFNEAELVTGFPGRATQAARVKAVFGLAEVVCREQEPALSAKRKAGEAVAERAVAVEVAAGGEVTGQR